MQCWVGPVDRNPTQAGMLVQKQSLVQKPTQVATARKLELVVQMLMLVVMTVQKPMFAQMQTAVKADQKQTTAQVPAPLVQKLSPVQIRWGPCLVVTFAQKLILVQIQWGVRLVEFVQIQGWG